MLSGLVFNIQRFSVHDGPGIRTTVFLKGCPLSCSWCCNPESQYPKPELMKVDVKCIRCGRCAEICPCGAIVVNKEMRVIERDKCNNCFKCVEVCPTGALIISGKEMTSEEVVDIVKRDALFYKNSGGGVTISGGEPLSQAPFTIELLKKCKAEGFHTAIDTSGFCQEDVFGQVLSYVDLLLYDVKHMDSETHRRLIGVDNKLILNNLKFAQGKVKIWIRVPLMHGFNDTEENLIKTADLALSVGAEKVSLLPFHEWGKIKYDKIDKPYTVGDKKYNIDNEDLQRVQNLIESYGIKVDVGK